ncbi:MAG: hypothetical protein HC945_04545 [Nitrosarchaeum sp.]|nr:hypothetical protein [Nitrosarchaeum sp.]
MSDIVAMACRLGPMAALDYTAFRDSLKGMSGAQSRTLLRAWIASESLPNDASREKEDILIVVHALKHEWSKSCEK